MTAKNGEGVKGATYVKVNKKVEYEAFDNLPAPVREAIRNANFKYSSIDIAEAIANGMPIVDAIRLIRRLDAKYGAMQ